MPSNDFEIADPGLMKAAREAVEAAGKGLFGEFSVKDFQRQLDAQPPTAPYHEFGPSIRATWDRLLESFGNDGFALAHCAVMVDGIESFALRQPPGGYPESTLSCFRRSYGRILRKIAALDLSGYGQPRDLMFKDLGICRQTLMPGGARVIEPSAAFPRSIIFRGGLRQFFEAARFIMFRARGNAPYFNLHVHDFELEEFNEEGWRRLFLRIADLLESRPHMKGVFVGGGWLYDPNLAAVSPHLGYHLDLTVPNGARSFFYGLDDEKSCAFVKSEKRRRLFNEGKYHPALYILIWPRKELLQWASRRRSGCASA